MPIEPPPADSPGDTAARAARRARIEAAAEALLAENGNDGLSMRAVARRASNETLYRWCGDTRGLFAALIARNAAGMGRRLDAAPEAGLDDPMAVLADIGPPLLSLLVSDRAIALNRAAAADATARLGRNLAETGRDEIAPRLGRAFDAARARGGRALDRPAGGRSADPPRDPRAARARSGGGRPKRRVGFALARDRARAMMAGMITAIDHVVPTVRAVCAFCARTLGPEAVAFGERRRALQAGDKKTNLQTLGQETRNHAAIGCGDLCLVTDDAPEIAAARLRTAGIRAVEGPVANTGARGPITSVCFDDADGNLVEIPRHG